MSLLLWNFGCNNNRVATTIVLQQQSFCNEGGCTVAWL